MPQGEESHDDPTAAQITDNQPFEQNRLRQMEQATKRKTLIQKQLRIRQDCFAKKIAHSMVCFYNFADCETDTTHMGLCRHHGGAGRSCGGGAAAGAGSGGCARDPDAAAAARGDGGVCRSGAGSGRSADAERAAQSTG